MNVVLFFIGWRDNVGMVNFLLFINVVSLKFNDLVI